MRVGAGPPPRAGAATALAESPREEPSLARILLGIDFGVPSVRSLEWVAEYLAPLAALHLVYVLDPEAGHPGAGGRERIADALVARRAGQAAEHLADLARGVSAWRCSTEVRVGAPDQELANAAREWGAELVSIGPHTHPGGARRGLGSTAERLLACSPVPVILAAHVRLSSPERVIAAVHDSRSAATVLAWANHVARELRAELGVVRLRPPGGAGREGMSGRLGTRVLERLQGEGGDLLILGSHVERSPRSLLESTVRTVLAAPPCPVLLVSNAPCRRREAETV